MLSLVLAATDGALKNDPLRADVATLTAIVSVFLPIIVAFVTKQVAHPAVKAILLAALSTVTALVAQAIEADGVFTMEAIQAGILSFVVASASYFGFWKPTDVTPSIQRKLPGGVG